LDSHARTVSYIVMLALHLFNVILLNKLIVVPEKQDSFIMRECTTEGIIALVYVITVGSVLQTMNWEMTRNFCI